MKKQYTIFFLLLSLQIFAQDLVIETFSEAHHSGANTITQTFNFPEDVSNFEKIEMRISLTCPTGGCDSWDRIAWLQLHTEVNTFEIGRYATPYGNDWCSWLIDVSAYRLLLSGEVSLSSYIETWDKGWLLDVDFEFYEGTPEYQYISVENLWAGNETDPSLTNNNNYYNFLYGEPFFNYNLPSKIITIPSNREKSMVRIVNTGHGQANTHNAAEFSDKTHELKINNLTVANHHLWNSDCNLNPCSPQSGTWQYARAGWCPGQNVTPKDIDITSNTYIWQELELDYVLEDYVNECTPWNVNCIDGITCTDCSFNGGSHTQPNYKIAIQLFHFSNEFMGVNENVISPISIYPNPANDVLNIRFPESNQSFRIECYNLQGQLVFNRVVTNSNTVDLSLKNIKNGVYTIKFVSQNTTYTHKLILSH